VRVLLCPDSFKGSVSSVEVTCAIAQGLREAGIEGIVGKPLADGGEGTLEVFHHNRGGEYLSFSVMGPWGEEVEARLLLWEDTALVEMAQAAGLLLVPPEKRNPRFTTTYGVGELLAKALTLGVRRVILTVGGSVTTDGGMGALQALGVRFLDEEGQELFGIGDNLLRIASLDYAQMILKPREVEFLIACDVENPLYGEEGAAWVYAPQKGASREEVRYLDEGLRHYATMIRRYTGVVVDDLPGGGAGGGVAAGLYAFWGGRIISGGALFLEEFGIEEEVAQAHWVITGEGRVDAQTRWGKLVWQVQALCARYGKPLVVIGGQVDEEAYSLFPENVALFALTSYPAQSEGNFAETQTVLRHFARSLGRIFRGGERIYVGAHSVSLPPAGDRSGSRTV